MRLRSLTLAAVLTLGALFAADSARGWSPPSQGMIGRHALRIAPIDFARQLEKYEREFVRGLGAPFNDRDASLHQENLDGGRLTEVIVLEVERTIASIRAHKSFRDIAYQAGVLVHYINDANNPLNCSNRDRQEGTYYADFLSYLESTEPRIAVLFYGIDPMLEKGDVEGFIKQTLERCRERYPMIGEEYRRIGKLPGVRYFDDRSTAFGLAALAHSRAVTDAALLLRHVWVEAGGADWRSPPSIEEHRLLLLPGLD